MKFVNKLRSIGMVITTLAQFNASGQNHKIPPVANCGNQYAAPYSYDTYCNVRFGYCLDYPTDILSPQTESENGDGRVFMLKNNTEFMRVYGNWMLDPEDTENKRRELEHQYNEEI